MSTRPLFRLVRCVLSLAVVIVILAPSISAHDGLAGRIAAVTAQIAKAPANAELLLRRADLYRAAHKWALAHADLDRILEIEPKMAGLDFVRAQVYFGAGADRSAVQAASRALARDPRYVGALIVRGRARVRLGLAHAAATDFTGALDQRPAPDLYIERARALSTAYAKNYEAALRGLDEGLARLGWIVTLELEAIDLELRLKRYDAALGRLHRISAHSARQETWLARRGAILEQSGRTSEARAAYQAALAAAMGVPVVRRQTRTHAVLIERLQSDLARLGIDASDDPQRRTQ
jgi:tetratricopeptide (TPR) repeat protein